MDSLTQIVLGAAVGEAVLGKKVGNKAILWGAIAGTIPDLDIFTRFFTDPITSMELHRGFSHSILFSVLFAPILGWLVSKIHHKLVDVTWKDWSKLMFFSLVTHPLLDAHTNYGTQLFWPFDVRVAYNNIFIIDPLYTLPFLGFVIAAMFYKRTNKKRKTVNTIGLVVSSLYMLTTLGIKWFTYNHFEKNLHNQEIEYVEISNQPTALNTVLWSASIKTKDSFIIGYYSLLDSIEKVDFSIKIPKNHNLLGDLNKEKQVQQLIKMSKGWYAIEKKENYLIFNDLRFGLLGFPTKDKANFAFSFKLIKDNGVLKLEPNSNRKKLDISKALSALFKRMKGK
ncbi:MAG: metal-dependent hydrolase [Vicingaceae bacterium]